MKKIYQCKNAFHLKVPCEDCAEVPVHQPKKLEVKHIGEENIYLADGVTVKKSDVDKIRLSGNGGGWINPHSPQVVSGKYAVDMKGITKPPQVEEWEKEFDEDFNDFIPFIYSNGGTKLITTREKAKSFIAKTILQTRADERREMVEKIKEIANHTPPNLLLNEIVSRF